MSGQQSFDYLILGAGSAGCVLANRLSAAPGNTVCIVEAGPSDGNLAIHIPPLIGMAIANPRLNWQFCSAPQAGLGGRQFPIPRGKVLGGSSSINGMVYFRGHPGDFDDWATLGNPGWGYSDVLPYFRRSESNPDYPDSPYHGQDGEMRVTTPRWPNPLVHRFVEATRGLQLRANADFNGPDPEGFGIRQATIRNGRRVSTASAFLDPARSRPNLRIVTEAFVERLVIRDGRACGAEVRIGGQIQRIEARKEVILCGGAYGSPAILMHSGIGDGAALSRLGIETVLHLPEVGRNLTDHSSAEVRMRTDNPEPYGLTPRSLLRNIRMGLDYALFRRGPLTGNIFEATGFVKSDPALPRPDTQLVFMPAARSARPVPTEHGYGIISIAARPKSRGSVTLASPDPRTDPVIDPGFLSHPDDIDVIRKGLILGRRILSSPVFDRYRAEELVPGASVRSEAELDDYIRATAGTVHHPASTCRMGADAQSVVDPQLRLRGISGLRVADASIFPTLVAGNTAAAVVMVAEKAADLILGRQPPPPADLPHAP